MLKIMIKKISKEIIIPKVKEAILKANFVLEKDLRNLLKKAQTTEESPLGKEVLSQIIENYQVAEKTLKPLCQDTGFAVFFVEIGHLCLLDDTLENILNTAVSEAYVEGYLRKSILKDPLLGGNTNDNTPAVIHTKIVKGNDLKIKFCAKGGGAENMSKIKMMKPSDGIEGIKDFVLDTILNAKSNPCPPIILGIGIGGTFEKCAQLAKKALFREIGVRHPEKIYADLEEELLTLANKTGIGPSGYGGKVTALEVFIEKYPRHIASFPVAINIQCHSSRHICINF